MKFALFKNKLPHILILAIALIISFFLLPFFFDYLIRFSIIKYNIGFFNLRLKYYWLGYLIYIVVSYKYNLSTLRFINKENLLNLSLQMVIDIFIIPLSIYILIVYYNKYSTTGLEEIGSLINILLILFILILKHIVILFIFNKFFLFKKKSS